MPSSYLSGPLATRLALSGLWALTVAIFAALAPPPAKADGPAGGPPSFATCPPGLYRDPGRNVFWMRTATGIVVSGPEASDVVRRATATAPSIPPAPATAPAYSTPLWPAGYPPSACSSCSRTPPAWYRPRGR